MFKIPIVNHSLKYNPSLDGIRGIAIISVLLFHIWPNYFKYGYLGVDLFFVLSGFLITKIIYSKLEKDKFNFLEFYRNRIRRIFPSVIIVLIITFIIGYLFFFPSELKDLGHHIESSAFFYENFRLMHEVGYWDKAAELKPLLHFWSLAIEEQFYLIWPLIIVFIYKIDKDFFIIKFLLLFIFFTSLAYFLSYDKFYHPLSRFWELSFGALLFSLSYKYKKDISSNNKFLSFYPLVFLGLISFPLYLWHYAIISCMHIFDINVPRYGFLVILISIILSYLTYRHIEIYARKQASFKFAISISLILVLIGLLGRYTYLNDGFKNRIFLVKTNKIYRKQFIREPAKNKEGMLLVKKVLGYSPNNNYIKATSADLSKNYIAIIGDSHAHSSYPGFAQEFKKRGFETILIANSSCPPYVGGARGKNIKDLKQCAIKIKNIYKILEAIPNLKKTIFATRGTVYMKGFGYGIVDGGNKPSTSHYKNYFLNKKENSLLEFTKNLINTFKYFNNKSYNLYYLMENPELGFLPKNCMIRPFKLFNSKCKIKLQDFLNRQKDYRTLVYNTVKKYSKVKLLDPKELYCDNKFCYAIKDNKMLYADDDHHSLDGSKIQAKYFIGQIFNDK